MNKLTIRQLKASPGYQNLLTRVRKTLRKELMPRPWAVRFFFPAFFDFMLQ